MRREPLNNAEVAMRDIARSIKRAMPPGWGYFLCLASFDEPGVPGAMTYGASIERETAVKLLRELADKLERQEPHL